MTTEKLYEFLILSKTLNFSSASETLYVSQSVLSKHISDLEAELGTLLFTRNTHSVSLTPAGYLLAREAPGLIDTCEHALNQIRISNLPVSGSVRIGCSVEFTYANHIRDFLRQFKEHYPDIHLQIDILTNGTPEKLIKDYDFLLTPCIYPHPADDIDMLTVQRHGTYAALFPGHRLLSKYLLQLKDLENETILVPFIDELFGPYAQNWQLIRKYTHDHVNAIPTDNLSTALFLVSLQQGIAIVPRYAKYMLPASCLFVGISSSSCRFDEHLYYHHNTENGAAKLFLEEFHSIIRE